MKLLAFFTLIAITTVSAKSYSQPTKLTFNFENVPVSQVFKEIEQNSDYILIYNEKTLDINRKVIVIADNDSIETILNKVFSGTKNTFNIYDRQIVISLLDEEPIDINTSNNVVELQQVTITGKVTDAATGEGLIGVTVLVKGTTSGALTDINGNFTIPTSNRQPVTLLISFIGYKRQEVQTSSGTPVNVALVLEVTQISEVIVTGYSIQKKESIVGAISQVKSEALIQSGATNITNAITGKLSGVLTIQQTGEPGSNQSEIIIRGLSSWNGSAPLTLIDGVERDFSDMDPNEISTISVLKDASATAVFGSKGANGVIIVTTKRGYLGKPQMTFTSSIGMQVPTRIPSFIDSYTTMSMLNVARMNNQEFSLLTSEDILNEYRNPSTPLNALRYPNVNWFDVNSKAFSPTENSNISVVGGTDFIKYFASIGYMYEGSLFKQAKDGYHDSNYWYKRFNYRTNIDFTLTKTTTLSVNLGGEVGIKNSPMVATYGNWKAFYGTTGADFPAYYPEWVLEQIPDTDYPDATGVRRAASTNTWFSNPYNNINETSFERYLDSKLYTDLILDQKLDFIFKGLSAKAKVSFNTYYEMCTLRASYSIPNYRIIWSRVGVDADKDGYIDQNPWERDGQGLEYYYPAPLNINVGGMEVSTAGLISGSSGGNAFYKDLYYEISLNYNHSFGKHNVTGLALMNRQEKDLGTEFPYYNAAFVGRATYDYSNKYLLEINIGYTGSERFAPGNRYGFFPSSAVGWVISEENFFKNAVPWMNKLKIRYSDGLVGSDYAANRWLYISDYYTDTYGYVYQDRGANANAQWEEARKKDLGIEVGVFKNLFTFNVDLFDEYRDKMLLTPRNVTFLVGNSFKDLNLGKLKKHGIELEVEFNKTTANKINYFIKGNFGFSENRIIFKDDPIYAPEYTKVAGKPLGSQLRGVVRTGTGFYTSINDIHINPSPVLIEKLLVGDYKFLDYNTDARVSTLDGYPIKGQLYAPINYSFSGGFKYKGFDFNVMFQGNYGKYQQFGPEFMVEFYKGSARVHSDQINYWRPNNQDVNHSTLHFTESDGGDAIHKWGSNIFDGIFWREASYLRLKEVYVGYNVNSGFLKQLIGISNILVYCNATNVLTFTKLLKEFDPEVKSEGGGFYPQLSRYNLGLKVSF